MYRKYKTYQHSRSFEEFTVSPILAASSCASSSFLRYVWQDYKGGNKLEIQQLGQAPALFLSHHANKCIGVLYIRIYFTRQTRPANLKEVGCVSQAKEPHFECVLIPSFLNTPVGNRCLGKTHKLQGYNGIENDFKTNQAF